MDGLRITRLRQALTAAEANYRQLAENLPGGIFQLVLRPDGGETLHAISQRCVELLELEPPRPDCDAALLWQLVEPADLPALRDALQRSALEMVPWQREFRVRTASGRQLWLQGQGRPRSCGDGSVCLQNLLLDISDARLAGQALARSEARFHDLLEGMEKISVQGYDAERRVIYWNSASAQLYGYSHEEAIGRRLEDLIIPPAMRELVIAATQEWLAAGTVSTPAEELVLRHKDGSEVHVLSCHTMQRNSRGEAELYCVDIDLSERVRAEAERAALEARLREAQKLEAIGTLAGGIAHDFNNVLGAILGNVALAMQQLPADHPAVAHLGLIRIGGERGRSLVQQILSFSRRRPLALRQVHLQALMRESLALLDASMPSGVIMCLDIAEEPLHVLADATQIQQVLMNLCTNAWHALHGETGRIELGLQALHQPGEAARAHLWVRDEGSGMDEATRERLFEPFFTTKPQGEGTGLGLAVAHGIVLAHHGEIQVDSEPGRGSCFHLYLPLVDAPLPALSRQMPADLPPESPTGQGRHLAYVDDDEVMRLTVQALLQGQGYRVSLCANTAEALALVASGGIELVMSDYNMPQGGGLELARQMKALAPTVPVLICSGHITDTLRDEARLLGVRALLNKEQIIEDMSSMVQRVLDEAV